MSRLLRWALDESLAALLVIAILGVQWVVVLRQHMLTIAHGNNGSYAEISIPETLTLDTRVEEFAVAVVPGRVVQIAGAPILPLPDMLHVTVRYSDASGAEHVWDKSYFIGCDDDGTCLPVAALDGAVLSGRARNGGVEVLSWAPLRARVPALNIVPRVPEPTPEPSPEPTTKPMPRPRQNG